jgi:MFS family permease
MLVLSFATQLWQAMLFAVIFGLGWGTRGPLLIAIRGDYFGRRYYATIMGLSQPMLMVGLLIGPLMAGYAYDILDSYQSAFIVITLANLLGAFLLVFLHPPKVARM